MMKILQRINYLLFCSPGGKITVSVFAIFGVLAFATSISRYDYAYELVKEERQKQKWHNKNGEAILCQEVLFIRISQM